MKFRKYTKEQIQFLKDHYPDKGKMWCVASLNLKEHQVRYLAAILGLRLNRQGDWCKEWQLRSSISHTGKKRPDQSILMKELWKKGILRAFWKGKRFAPRSTKNCVVCGKTFEALSVRNKIMCSMECRRKDKDVWLRTPHPKGMLGKKHTNETKSKISHFHKGKAIPREQVLKSMKKRYQNGWTPPSVNRSWKSGRSEDLGNIFFRSRWERNYARYLNFLIKHKNIMKWEYEVETFWFDKIKRGVVCYKPDFKVYNNDGSIEFHEVKGWMDPASKTKLKRMAKYHPKVKVIVIDGTAYKSLSKSKNLISKFWESDTKKPEGTIIEIEEIGPVAEGVPGK